MPGTVPTWIGCAPGNFRAGRPAPYRPIAIVLHVSTGSIGSADAWFSNPAAKVSAHYLVGKSGAIHQYVHETDTAFHAGVVISPTWSLLKPNVNPNFYTIGIEHEGQTDDTITPEQLASSTALVRDIATRWNIQLDIDHLISHHQIRASKPCPGDNILPQLWLETIGDAGGDASATLVETTAAVNLRSSATTSAPILRVLPAGSRLSVTGSISGQSVQGNSSWYAVQGGSYVWSGATKHITS